MAVCSVMSLRFTVSAFADWAVCNKHCLFGHILKCDWEHECDSDLRTVHWSLQILVEFPVAVASYVVIGVIESIMQKPMCKHASNYVAKHVRHMQIADTIIE